MHTLRSAFTEALATRLSQGAGINLVGPHGQGRRRTLSDLRRCLPASMPVLQANLREYPHSLAAMLADLCAQAGLSAISRWDALLERLRARRHPTLLILHNLDELTHGDASGYDEAFFAALNAIQDRTGLSVLCVSEGMHEAWPLHIEAMMLPPLTADEILAELVRRKPPVAASAWPGLSRWLAAQPSPYTLLERPEAWPSA